MPPKVVKKTEHLFKDLLEGSFRLLLRPGDGSRLPLKPADVSSILILRPDKLGDMIATLPAIHALKKTYPHITVEVMASPQNRVLVEGDPAVDAVHIYCKNITRDWPLIRRLKRRRFDIVFDPICHDSVTGLLLSRLIANGSVRAASRKLKLQRYYDYCEPYQPEGRDHNIDNGLLVFNVMGENPAGIDPFLPVHLPEPSVEKAQRFHRSLPKDDAVWIGVNISAGSPTRTLTVEKYAMILGGIVSRLPSARFLISCTMDERERGLQLREALDGRAHIVEENLSLLDACAVLDGLDYFISPDTSLVHLARLMKIPVVGLYSGHMRNYYFWKPYRQEHGGVVAKAVGNLHDIEPSRVVEEFFRLKDAVDNAGPVKVTADSDGGGGHG